MYVTGKKREQAELPPVSAPLKTSVVFPSHPSCPIMDLQYGVRNRSRTPPPIKSRLAVQAFPAILPESMRKTLVQPQLGIVSLFARLLAGVALFVPFLGLQIEMAMAGGDINQQPLWTVSEKLFCQGESMFSCSLENPISCERSGSNVAVTINFKEQIVNFHGVYRGGDLIRAVTFKNDMNPEQTILFGDGRVIQLAHQQYKHGLEIKGYLLDGYNIAYAEPKEIIKRGISGYVLRCHID
jgi:hypothetical protein